MKLTFVLLLSSGRDIDSAVNILLPSITQYFKLSDLDKFFIILKGSEINLFNLYVSKANLNLKKLKVQIVDENTLFNRTNITNTYYLQMYLKLLIANKIETNYYLTLDSDLYFCKKCDSTNFFTHKAFYQKFNKMDKWNKRVNKELDINVDFVTNQTPFVFVTHIVKFMLQKLDVESLILDKQCSEYTLYTGYCVKNDLLEELYTLKKYICKPINYMTCKNITKDNQIILGESFMINKDEVIGCIQSRTNQLCKLDNLLKLYIPSITFKKLKIAVLTVVSNDEYYKKYREAFYTKRTYCNYHNYNFEFFILNENKYPKGHGWLKIYKLLEILPKYDYVFMSDADVIITNNDIRIEDLIIQYNLNINMMLITTDHNSLNSGNIIWRNCEDTLNFLKKVIEIGEDDIRYSLKKPYKPMGIYEQPTIIYLINQFIEYRNKIQIIPQFKMNSYLECLPTATMPNIVESINNEKNRCTWKEGDFLIHFAGTNYDFQQSTIDFNNLIKKYVALYKIFIIRKEGVDYGSIK